MKYCVAARRRRRVMVENEDKAFTTHYSFRKSYDTVERFISYFYQISLIRELAVTEILEIGIGNKTVSNYLKQCGLAVTTCDYDEDLKPDVVADIRQLPMEENSFDVVLACEILEHLPWEDVPAALDQLHRVTRRYAVVSVPYSCISLNVIFGSQVITRLFKTPCWGLFLGIPMFLRGCKFKGHGRHYWEMGRRGYSTKKVKKALREKFNIIKVVRPVLSSNLNHRFFVLEVKDDH